MFGIISNLAAATIKTASLPLAIVADVATCGGLINDKIGTNSYTEDVLESISHNVKEIF